jgi:carbonic anhydrase/acetyltransferase-like protein (isoleucine patch superfamily)
MTIADDASILSVAGRGPQLDPDSFVAAGARVIGAVTLGPGVSVWYNAVLRADGDTITVGAGSNLQDNVSVHVDAGKPVVIGENVSVGHNAVIHGCTIEDGSLIGMGAVVLNGARVGAGSLIAGGAVVLEGADIPPGSLVAGVPGKVRRALTDEERAGLLHNAEVYLGVHLPEHVEATPVPGAGGRTEDADR